MVRVNEDVPDQVAAEAVLPQSGGQLVLPPEYRAPIVAVDDSGSQPRRR